MAPSFVYVAIMTLTLASGASMEAEENNIQYPSYDACMLETESTARQMAREWEWEEERTGLPSFFKSVSVRCERRPAGKEARHGK